MSTLSRTLLRRIAAAVLLLGAAGAASAARLLANIPLEWRPTDSFTAHAPDAGTGKLRIHVAPLVDRRSNPPVIGENREDADKGKILPVTTRDDVALWTTERVAHLFGKAGFEVVGDDGADLQLSGEILDFFVTETGTYQGEVRLRLVLSDRNGRRLWSGLSRGSNSRFGRSYKADNYCEVLSDSLLNAIDDLIVLGDFQAAVTDRTPGN